MGFNDLFQLTSLQQKTPTVTVSHCYSNWKIVAVLFVVFRNSLKKFVSMGYRYSDGLSDGHCPSHYSSMLQPPLYIFSFIKQRKLGFSGGQVHQCMRSKIGPPLRGSLTVTMGLILILKKEFIIHISRIIDEFYPSTIINTAKQNNFGTKICGNIHTF